MARNVPTDGDRAEVIRIALSGLARGRELFELRREIEPLHPEGNTFPGEVLLGLAADAIELSGASRESPIEFEGIRERHLPECTAHTNAQHQHSKYALRAAAMIRAGVNPGLLNEVIWWRSDDLWMWALDALAVYVRAAAHRTALAVDVLCERLAQHHGIDLSART